MKNSSLTVTASIRVERPIAVVRRHTGDVEHHARNGVHPDLKFTLLSESEHESHFLQQYRLAGIPFTDEILMKRAADGSITSDCVSGSNVGMRLTSRFRADGPSVTVAEVTIEMPLRGWKRLIAPLGERIIKRRLAKGLEEDRRDLERGSYE